jgi:hypothetical protein
MPGNPLTQDYLDAHLRGAVKEIIGHFNASQGKQNEKLDTIETTQQDHSKQLEEIDVKVTAIMDQLALRQELQNLVRELQAKGVAIDPSKVFVSPEASRR